MKMFQQFINGEAMAAADGKTEKISSPATEEVLAEVPVGGAEDVERAVTAAHQAFESWFDRTPGERAGMLLRLADRIDAHAAELAALEAANVGKPMWLAKSEIPFLSDNLRFFAGAAR
jgi:betaine-aldehyde dehydrogenase/aminobutyraldehyde dehydrogenase